MNIHIREINSNEYKVWAMVSNSSQQQTTSEIINDYKLREKLIQKIVDMALEYDLDGINLDFENVKKDILFSTNCDEKKKLSHL